METYIRKLDENNGTVNNGAAGSGVKSYQVQGPNQIISRYPDLLRRLKTLAL